MFFSHSQITGTIEIQEMKMLLPILYLLMPAIVSSQARYAVVIHEIMADPSPQVGLPNHEWVEITNTSEEPVDLRGWRLGDNTNVSGAFPGLLLMPGQYLILCASSARISLEALGEVLVVPSFPSLDNAGEQLYLLSNDGRVMHAVLYTDVWHENSLKKEGGWSLEMIDPHNPCAGRSNWKSSVSLTGGTPGHSNSVAGFTADETRPVLLRSYSTQSSVVIVFDEPLDSNTAVGMNNYRLDPLIAIRTVSCRPPLFNEVQLEIEAPMNALVVYDLAVKNVKDCLGNEMTDEQTVRTGVFSQPGSTRPVINEILFNPRPGGYDYVEIYNNGPGITDASQLHLANRNTADMIGIPVRVSAEPFALFPGDYLVATPNASSLFREYFVKDPLGVLDVSLPSYPDDKGTVILMGPQGEILDEVRYTKDWHFKLISDPDGVALERIDPLAPSSSSANWHSAASTVGYGTPTARNSQFMGTPAAHAEFDVNPKIFSPNNDGRDDQTRITYATGTSGLMATVQIFDAGGRLVKVLVNNELLGANGYWNWNGLNQQQHILPTGIYVIQIELFTLSGSTRRIRKAVVLARQL